jgi:type II secretory pathway pseudopilin PulG
MKSERGFTMIELIIASMLSVLVLVVVGGMLINSLSSQRVVLDATQASNTVQFAAKSVTRSVRNASDLRLTAPVAGEQLLEVRTAGTSADAGVFRCQAWYYSAGELRMTSSNSAIAAPTPAQLATWTLIGSGIQQVAGAPVFALTGRQVDIKIDASAGDGAPVLVSTTAVSRQPVPTTAYPPTCF